MLNIHATPDITSRINNKTYEFGRPSNNIGDTIYSMVFKVYSTFSGRRFSTDLKIAKENGFAEQKIPYNSMFRYFQKKELTPLLANIVAVTSLPLNDKYVYDSNFTDWILLDEIFE